MLASLFKVSTAMRSVLAYPNQGRRSFGGTAASMALFVISKEMDRLHVHILATGLVLYHPPARVNEIYGGERCAVSGIRHMPHRGCFHRVCPAQLGSPIM